MNNAVISFIVPIYGVAKYLRKCLDSILMQSMPDFEVILIDDGSTDGCAQICDEYTQRDARFRVIHQSNGGRSKARNAGIDACTTKWIWFVDGDDYIEPDALERACAFLHDDYDMIIFGNGKAKTDYLIRELSQEDIRQFFLLTVDDSPNGINPDSQWLRNYLFQPILFRFYNTDFIEKHHIRFNESLEQGQDRFFQIEAIKHRPRIAAIAGCFYDYERHEDAISFQYSERALYRSEMLSLAVCDSVSFDAEALKRYYCYVMDNIKVCLRVYFLHKDNPKSRHKRACELRKYMKRPFIQEAIKKCDWSLAGYKLFIFSTLCQTGSLRLLHRIYKGLFNIKFA